MEIVTVKEVAEFIKVKEKTLYQWAELGQIPHIKINGSVRFDYEDLRKWVSSCKKAPSSSYNSLARPEARKGGIKQ